MNIQTFYDCVHLHDVVVSLCYGLFRVQHKDGLKHIKKYVCHLVINSIV